MKTRVFLKYLSDLNLFQTRLCVRVPPIAGYEVVGFIELMETYRNGERQNQAMVSVAKALDAEQIKALAVCFASVKPKE